MKQILFYIIIVLLFFSCQRIDRVKITPATKRVSVQMADYVWDNANMEYSRFKSREEFLVEIEYYIREIGLFTSRENWYTEYKGRVVVDDFICIVDFRLTDGVSNARQTVLTADNSLMPRIYLNQKHFEHDIAPIIHEITHVMFKNTSSSSFYEGFANYCQVKFDKGQSVADFGGLNVHTHANMYLVNAPDMFDILLPLIGEERKENDSDLHSVFIILSHSYIDFLINNYGIENFMKLYNSKNLYNDYLTICGKSLEELKEDWLEMIKNYSDTISVEEFQKIVTDFYLRHNYKLN
jgi:hypothetical protein